MSWLEGVARDRTDLTGALHSRPRVAESFDQLWREVWASGVIDAPTLELARIRVCQLLGSEGGQRIRTRRAIEDGLQEELVDALADWPHDERFTEHTRAALAFTEAYSLDAKTIPDDVADAAGRHLGDRGLVLLTVALGLFECWERFCLFLGLEPPADGAVVDGPVWDA